jgi:hypothetical protein
MFSLLPRCRSVRRRKHVGAGGDGDQLIKRELLALVAGQRPSQALRQTSQSSLEPSAVSLGSRDRGRERQED